MKVAKVEAPAAGVMPAAPAVSRAALPAPAEQAAAGRPRCAGCGRPPRACWCACVRVVDNPTALLILQDPLEQRQAKGTAALLQRCLRRVECRVGESFDPPAELQGLALLYPETPGDRDLLMPPPWPDAAPHTLVLLDGTWRRSRRLLYLNPWLQQLPRLALQAPPPSRYAIRRAAAPRQRSSLEAAALALAQLEQASERYAPLWQAMEAFITLQQNLAASGR